MRDKTDQYELNYLRGQSADKISKTQIKNYNSRLNSYKENILSSNKNNLGNNNIISNLIFFIYRPTKSK